MPVLTGFYTPVFMHGEGVIGLAAWKLDLRPIQQSAVCRHPLGPPTSILRTIPAPFYGWGLDATL
jgi:hypothetical protein